MTKRDVIMGHAKECLSRYRNAKNLARDALKRGDVAEHRFLEESAEKWMNAIDTWITLAADMD